MGISITKSNVLTGVTPSITGAANPTQNPANISSPDHSLNYTSGQTTDDFFIDYGEVLDIDYVALSGWKTSSTSPVTIELRNETFVVQSVVLSRSNNFMFTFDRRDFSSLILRFTNGDNSALTTVSFVAAGQLIDVEEGEQAGYKRNWLKRSVKQRTTSNRTSAPVSAIQKTEPLSATLNIPNIDAHLSQNEYQDFIDYTFEQPFFIKEVELLPESSYICYDPEHDIVAHRATPLLNRATIKFNAYNGLE